MVAHMASVQHVKELAKKTAINGRGGLDPLQSCVCGMYVVTSKVRQHKQGDLHKKYYNMKADGCETCTVCSLPYY